MPRHLIIPSEEETMLVASYLTHRSTPFTTEPLPDGEYQVSIKDEVYEEVAKWLSNTNIKARALSHENFIPIVGLNESGKAAKAHAALTERNHIDYQCYMLLQEYVESCTTQEGFGCFVTRATEFCRLRREANDRFIRLMCVPENKGAGNGK